MPWGERNTKLRLQSSEYHKHVPSCLLGLPGLQVTYSWAAWSLSHEEGMRKEAQG